MIYKKSLMSVFNAWETFSAQVVRVWAIHKREKLHSGKNKIYIPSHLGLSFVTLIPAGVLQKSFRNMRISLHINVADHPRRLSGLVLDWQLLNFVLFLCVRSVCKCELITVKCQYKASVHLSMERTLKRTLQKFKSFLIFIQIRCT